jgi:hypothetical protein
VGVVVLGLVVSGLAAPPATAATAQTSFTTEKLGLFAGGAQNTSLYRVAALETPSVTGVTNPYRLSYRDSSVGVNNRHVLFAAPTGGRFTAGQTVTLGAKQDAATGIVEVSNDCGARTGTVTGTLRVDAATYSSSGALTSFAGSYDGTCTASSAERVAGVLRVASAAPVVAVSVRDASARTGIGMSTPMAATVTNIGTVAVVPGTASLSTSGQPEHFALTGDGCAGVSLAPGATCTINATFTPANTYLRATRVEVPLPGHPRGWLGIGLSGQGAEPPTVPSAPTFFPTPGGVGLRWSDSATATSYELYRRAPGAADWTLLQTATKSIAVDAGLTAGTSAEYSVIAVGVGGPSARSAVGTVTRPVTDPARGAVTAMAVQLRYPSSDEYTGVIDARRSGHEVVGPGGGGVTLTGTDPAGRVVSVTIPSLTAPGTYDWDTDLPGYGVRTSLGNGAVCVTRAQVRVRSVLYDAAGEIDVLDADVVGWCGTSTVPSLLAELRRNSTAEYAALTNTPSVLERLHVAVGAPTAAQTVTVRNTGTLPVTTGAVEVRGEYAADWSVTGSTCAIRTLAPGAACTVTLVFTPGARGPRDAELSLGDDTLAAGRLPILLHGTGGLLPSAPGDPVVAPLIGRAGIAVVPPADDGGTPVLSYRVRRSTAGGAPVVVAEVSRGESGLTYVDRGLVSDAEYTYSVAAVTVAGEGPESAAVTVRIPSAELIQSDGYISQGAGYVLVARSFTGGKPVVLVAEPGFDLTEPAVSPDGRQVAYRRTGGTDDDLWVRAVDGSGKPVRLTSVAGVERRPVWSADGRTIAFTHHDASGARSVWTVPAAGGTAARRATGAFDPAFLPDGMTLVVAAETPARLEIVDPAGRRTPVPGGDGGTSPAVSPDGTAVAFHLRAPNQPSLAVTSLTGSGPAAIYPGLVSWAPPAWSADGRSVLAGVEGYRGESSGDWLSAIAVGNGPQFGESVQLGPQVRARIFAVRALGVHLAGPARATQSRASFAVAADPGVIATTCRLDGGEAEPCGPTWTRSGLTPGSHLLRVSGTRPDGALSTTAWRWTVDLTAPRVSVVVPGPTTLGTSVPVQWSGSDAASGVASWDVRYRSASYTGTYGAYVYPASWQRATTRSATLRVAEGRQYCVSARATDVAGNTSAWSAERCVLSPLDDRRLVPSTEWLAQNGSWYHRGTVRTTVYGGTLTRTGVYGQRFVLVASKCRECGSVEVRVGKTLIGRVSLWGTYRDQVVIPLPVQARPVRGTLVVRVTSTRGRVSIDGLGVGRQ